MSNASVKTSKFLSLVLRHAPETIGLELDANGWVDVDELLAACSANGRRLSIDVLEEVVFTNDKQRFAFSEDGRHIRANQGHSVEVDLALQPTLPPAMLFHGTATRFLDAIRAEGLRKMSRQHVHLSSTEDQARRVGARHGKPIVLTVNAQAMAAASTMFYISANGVWLTDAVPVEFLLGMDEHV